jgi:hypothetical protein
VIALGNCGEARAELVGSCFAELALLAILEGFPSASTFASQGDTRLKFHEFSLVLCGEWFRRGVEICEEVVDELCNGCAGAVQSVRDFGEGLESFSESVVGGE